MGPFLANSSLLMHITNRLSGGYRVGGNISSLACINELHMLQEMLEKNLL